MPPRRVVYDPAAASALARLPIDAQTKVTKAVEKLAKQGAGDIKKLQGRLSDKYRLRVGPYRVIFSLSVPGQLSILDVDTRGHIY